MKNKNLPPLIQAVMQDNAPLVKELLKNEHDPDCRDHRLWTPLHHAALLQKDEIYTLLESDLNQSLKNDLNATAKDLLNLLGKLPQEMPHVIIEVDGVQKEGDAELFEKILNARFTTENRLTAKALLDEWASGKEGPSNSHDRFASQMASQSYFSMLKRPFRFLLKKQIVPIDGELVDTGYHLYAAEKIPIGSCVVEYVGQYREDRSVGSPYAFGPYDAEKVRGLGAMVADGFPNVIPVFLYCKKGLKLRIVFIAIEEILPGEMICFNYGKGHSVKQGKHFEFRKEKLISYFQKNPKEKLEQMRKKLSSIPIEELGWKRYLQLQEIQTKIEYIHQTPSSHSILKDIGLNLD